jgi:signal transduction histidine kinase
VSIDFLLFLPFLPYSQLSWLRLHINDVSRLEAGRLPVEIKAVGVAELLQEIKAETQDVWDQTDVQARWHVQSNLPLLHTDPGKLKVVIKNLIGNVIKFTAQGSITVAADEERGGITIEVSDTGIGIPADELPMIFEPFRQLESAKQCRSGGTGLGLYIVKRLLELLEGQIAVKSEVGRGSTFRVWVPIMSEVEASRELESMTWRGKQQKSAGHGSKL